MIGLEKFEQWRLEREIYSVQLRAFKVMQILFLENTI